MMDKVHVHMCFHTASIKFIAGKKIRLFRSPFIISNSRFLVLAKAFRSDYVAACNTALRNATEKSKTDGYVTVPCSPKWNSVVAEWIKLNSFDITRLVATKHIRHSDSVLKSRSVI